jgi:hypothetical protein
LLWSSHHWNPQTVATAYFQISEKVLELLRATFHANGIEPIPVFPRPYHQWSGDSVGIHYDTIFFTSGLMNTLSWQSIQVNALPRGGPGDSPRHRHDHRNRLMGPILRLFA